MGSPGRLPGEWLPAAKFWRLSAPTAGRLSTSARLSASTAGNRRLSAATCLRTSATSWWISSAAARGVRTSGPSGWRPWYPRCADQEEPSNDHCDRRCGNRPAGSRGWHHHGADPRRRRAARCHHVTPSQPVPPTEQPTPEPTGEPTTAEPQPSPTQTSRPPTGGALNIGNGIQLKPAAGWQLKKSGENVAQLSDGKSVFLGQSLQISQSTNPGQLCDAWHRNVAEGTSNGKFQDAKDANVGTSSLKAATCVAEVTVSGGQGTTKLYLFSLVSVRQSDGVTVIGTAYFTPNAETEQLNKDFTSMVNSMLESQVAGG